MWQTECPICNSKDINIKTDSHWIFSIKSDDELDLLLNRIPRIILILFDKESEETDDIRLRAWTVDPKNEYVHQFYKEYYYNNYMKKPNAAPCNLHPLLYDFHLMKPKLIFHADININKKDVDIVFWDVEHPKAEKMPSYLLTEKQLKEIFADKHKGIQHMPKSAIVKLFPYIQEDKIDLLEMREKKTKSYKQKYRRR